MKWIDFKYLVEQVQVKGIVVYSQLISRGQTNSLYTKEWAWVLDDYVSRTSPSMVISYKAMHKVPITIVDVYFSYRN